MKTLRINTTIEGVATITLHRPEVRNAFNSALIAELGEAFSRLSTSVRVVVLTGAEPVFCAGADLEWMKKSATYSQEQNAADAMRMLAMFRVIDEAPQAVIARINGTAMGGALGLIAACDIAVSVAAAKFAFSEVRLGIVPAVISPFVMRKIGAAQARRYFLTGELFNAARALQMGLIHEVCPKEDLDTVVHGLVQAILNNGPMAVREAKQLVREVWRRDALDADDALAHAVETIARLRVSAEGQEGLGAFLQKRKPQWQ